MQSSQSMLTAKEESEVLLKAEVVHLTEGMARLQEECLQHQGKAMGLQELVSEISASGDATTVCTHCELSRVSSLA